MQTTRSIYAKNVSFWRDCITQENRYSATQARIIVLTIVFLLAYLFIALRLSMLVLLSPKDCISCNKYYEPPRPLRSDIVDCNGVVLATDVVSYSVFADPQVVPNAQQAVKSLKLVLPDLQEKILVKRLVSEKRFMWIARHVSPYVKHKINELGIPGVYFKKEYQRFYPYGPLTSHVLGYCDIEGNALCGVERYFHERLQFKASQPLQLALDIRLQHISYDILQNNIKKFQAKAGNILLIDDQGEVKSAISMPDFNPNKKDPQKIKNALNRNFQGCYEMGSTLKIINAAIALETKTATLKSSYDARYPIYIGRFKVDDFCPKRRILSFEESFIYSSNIACVKMAVEYGPKIQQYYFKKLGLLEKPKLELNELGRTLPPIKWNETVSKSIAYGYGIALTPVSFLSAVATILNDGCKICPTLLMRNHKEIRKRVISSNVSQNIQKFMRITVTEGTGRKANVEGAVVMGKTGTAYQASKGGYDRNNRNTTFISSFQYRNRKYFMIVMLEAPKPTSETYGFASAGWNVAPMTKECIERFSSILSIY